MSSCASQSDWRAANPSNTTPVQAPALRFENWTNAPYGTNANQFVRTPSISQLPQVPNNFGQARPNQHMPRLQFQQPRGQRAPSTPSQSNLYDVPSLMDTFAYPTPLAYEQQEPPPLQLNRSSSIVYAVESAGRDAPQVLAVVKLNGVQIDGALIDSGSSFSLIASLTLAALPKRLSVEKFMHKPPTIVGVSCSFARQLGYVDVLVVISDVKVRHPLIMVDNLEYPLLIGTDVLRPYRADFELGAPDVVQLKLDQCPVCVEIRLPDETPPVIVGAVASTLFDTTLTSHTASRLQVRLPPKVLADSHFLVEPISHEIATSSCAAHPSVCALIGATYVLSVVNVSDKPVRFLQLHPNRRYLPCYVACNSVFKLRRD